MDRCARIELSSLPRFSRTTLQSASFPLQVPTADGAARLRSLFPDNPRLELYLGALGDLRGTGEPFDVALGADPQTGIDRGPVQFATAAYVLARDERRPAVAGTDGSHSIGETSPVLALHL